MHRYRRETPSVVPEESRKTAAIPLLRPLLPTADKLLPYLQRIDTARYYTNFGALVRELEVRLAAHFGVTPAQTVLVSNGTTALSAALLASGAAAGSRCLMPSWTFVASAAAACAANLVPHFIDVEGATWMPDPAALAARSDLAAVGAVMIVAPFGMPFDSAGWDRFTAKTGIPVIIDAAAGFDSVATIATSRAATAPVMVSLHATKVLGSGEGGVVISRDDAFVHRLRQVCNFGIWGSPDDQSLGYNGKMSEYHAAVALAALDEWPSRRAALAGRTGRYAATLARLDDVRLSPGYAEGWVSAYCTVLVERAASDVERALLARQIESRRWWVDGVHRLAAYRTFTRDPLPVTEALTEHALSLPFSHDLTDDQMDAVARAVGAAVA
jgi:dTDP-4-amino-4,6-dideoxygalactose transaminase